MQRFHCAAIVFILSALGLANGAMAQGEQTAIPEFRYVATPDTDFYGSDLDALFDTDLESCIRACTFNSRCAGFTYNARSSACFPKAAVSERTPYAGALSAEKLPNAAALLRAMLARSRVGVCVHAVASLAYHPLCLSKQY